MTISRKKFLAVILLFSSSFAWFYVFYNYFNEIIPSTVSSDSIWYDAGLLLFLIFTVISAFIGSSIAGKINRRKFLLFWILFGILVTIPLPFIPSEELLPIFGILVGISFGLGFPSCMAFLAESTIPEERGRVAGVAILVAFLLVIISTLVVAVLGLESIGLLGVFIGIKLITFIAFALDPIDRVREKAKPWRIVLSSKDFNYYILAFVMFSIAAGLVALFWGNLYSDPEYAAITQIGSVLRYIGLGLFAIIAGVMADRVGRQKPIILGLIMLGAAYAIVGLVTTPETYFVNLLLSGFAWGVLFTVFLVVPGDLSYPGSTERYYAMGWLLPIILFIAIENLGVFFGLAPPINLYQTILSVIVLAAILPIIRAAETLSESKIRQQKFKDYTEKVGKIVQDSKKT